MPVLNDLNLCWEEKTQREATFEGRALLENLTTVLSETHDALTLIQASGNFDTIPTDLKIALNAWWTIFKTARTSIGGNANIMAVYNWRPPA